MTTPGSNETAPMAFDLFCGLGGWAEGFLAEGYRVIGFDIERRPYPGQLVLQDVLTLHGSQLRGATIIVGSSPCQEFSYRAMPWKRAKALPPPYLGMELFNAQFRIQREAILASGRYIPMVIENVKGAQPWVGRAKAHFGSFYLWGDVESLGNRIVRSGDLRFGDSGLRPGGGRKNNGGSWFHIGSRGQTKLAQNPVNGVKLQSLDGGRRTDIGKGARFTGRDCGIEGIKGFARLVRLSSGSNARKAASAQIAKIPLPLAQYIARMFKPEAPTGAALIRQQRTQGGLRSDSEDSDSAVAVHRPHAQAGGAEVTDLERCNAEIAEAERMLRSGDPREDLLYLWLQDQRKERLLILAEGTA